MTIKFALFCLLLTAALHAEAQSEEALPELPMSEDILNIDAKTAPAPAKEIEPPPTEVTPLVTDTAPQEPPFTQPVDEFGEASAPTISESEPVFTTPEPQQRRVHHSGKKNNVEMIEHPLAAKGLLRIEKDGSYIYKTNPVLHDQSATFRFGSMQPPNIDSADGQTNFKSMYSKSDIPIFLFDYEWQPFTKFGKLGIQGGVGFFTAQGNGRFLDGTQAKEKYTFYALPISLGLVYRFQYADNQWVAPYLAGGGTYFALIELRDDSKGPKLVGTPAAYGAGGLMFNISAFDRETAFTLGSEYGISNLWLSAEYRHIQTFTEDLSLTSGMINIGLSADY